jgi:hypothetical protein
MTTEPAALPAAECRCRKKSAVVWEGWLHALLAQYCRPASMPTRAAKPCAGDNDIARPGPSRLLPNPLLSEALGAPGSHQRTPDFLSRSTRQDRVCGFLYGKPHAVRQRHQPRQEIRVPGTMMIGFHCFSSRTQTHLPPRHYCKSNGGSRSYSETLSCPRILGAPYPRISC